MKTPFTKLEEKVEFARTMLLPPTPEPKSQDWSLSRGRYDGRPKPYTVDDLKRDLETIRERDRRVRECMLNDLHRPH